MYKKTKQREIILDLLKKSPTPHTAEMIASILPNEDINLATIYRNLNFFAEIGIVNKSFLNQTTYFSINQEEHHHYLICLSCKKMEEVDCHLHGIEEDLKKYSFKPLYHDMNFYGYCDKCKSEEVTN